MALFKQYRPGQDLGRDQTLARATRVTLLEDNPERYDRESLQTLANRPFTIQEWLLVTQDYLIYRTESAVMEHMRQVLLNRARWAATETGGELFSVLSGQIDQEETSIWLPLKGAHARPWVFQGHTPAMLGSKVVPFHYYEIQVATEALYFLQQPIGHRNAQRDFEGISALLRDAGTPEPG